MSEISLSTKIRFLHDPASYPEPPAVVEAEETHMSWVFLTDALVYKLKKPVRYPFLDFSTLEKRRADAEREVQLNRRLAGKTYLGVVPLTVDVEGELHLETAGRPVEFLVKMHRLPRDRMLDYLLQQNRVPQMDLALAAQNLATFYRDAAPALRDAATYLRRLADYLQIDRDGLQEVGDLIDGALAKQLHQRLARVLDELGRDLAGRVTAGRIIDGHGDLRPEHICLTPEPVFFDCLEFNQKLRTVDPLDEFAYLDIECRRYGDAEPARVFRNVYAGETDDPCPEPLFRFYQARRAYLRASLCAGHLREEAYDGSREWIEKTDWYLSQASACLRDFGD